MECWPTSWWCNRWWWGLATKNPMFCAAKQPVRFVVNGLWKTYNNWNITDTTNKNTGFSSRCGRPIWKYCRFSWHPKYLRHDQDWLGSTRMHQTLLFRDFVSWNGLKCCEMVQFNCWSDSAYLEAVEETFRHLRSLSAPQRKSELPPRWNGAMSGPFFPVSVCLLAFVLQAHGQQLFHRFLHL